MHVFEGLALVQVQELTQSTSVDLYRPLAQAVIGKIYFINH